MIGFLGGTVKKLLPGEALVLTESGVGYRVHIADVGIVPEQQVELFIHTAVRQDDISLWGFTDVRALQLFELLLTVSGVGLKTAFTLITVLDIENIVAAIAAGDATALKVPGIGAKTAERIIIDLRTRVEKLGLSLDKSTAGLSHNGDALYISIEEEAIAALESLGYKRSEVEKRLSRVPAEHKQSTSALIRRMLREL